MKTTHPIKFDDGLIELIAGQSLEVTKEVSFGPHHDRKSWSVGTLCHFKSVQVSKAGKVKIVVVDDSTKTPLPFSPDLLSDHFVKVNFPEPLNFME